MIRVLKSVNEPRHEKKIILVSDLVRHKSGCTATEDGLGLEMLDLESRGFVLCSEKKNALISCAVPRLICVFVFAYAKRWFSHDAAQMYVSK